MKKLVFVVSLLLVSSISPLVFGYDVEPTDTELDKMLDDLRFMCTTPNGFSEERYEYYREKILEQYSESSNDDVIIEPEEELTIRVEPPDPLFNGGPMDSAWPMHGHDVHHTGQSPYSTANNPGIEKWRFYSSSGIHDGPVIDNDGTIYIGNGGIDHKLYAIHPDGIEKWNYELDGIVLGSTPAISDDGTIYIGSWDYGGCLYAINPDGSIKWKFPANGAAISSSPAIADDGTIYFGTMWSLGDGGKIHAVNPNGTEKWRYQTGDAITSDPAIGDDGTVYIGSCDTHLYAMNPNGTVKWIFHTNDEVNGHPAIGEDGTIYIGSWDDYLYAINPDGTEKWKHPLGFGTSNSVAIDEDGIVYVGSNQLYAIYPDGTTKWAFYLGSSERYISTSSPAISADGTIYVGVNIGDNGGEILVVNSDGTEKWRKELSNKGNVQSSPSIAEDGTVYIGSNCDYRGYIHAFEDVDSNSPPGAPTISGPTNGEVGEEYWYTFVAHDPDNNPIQLYVDWGDGDSGWVDWFASDETMWAEHEWTQQGDYTIKAKVKDVMGEEGPWGYLDVTMPKNKPFGFGLLEWLLERFPNAFPLLRYIFKL